MQEQPQLDLAAIGVASPVLQVEIGHLEEAEADASTLLHPHDRRTVRERVFEHDTCSTEWIVDLDVALIVGLELELRRRVVALGVDPIRIARARLEELYVGMRERATRLDVDD